MLRTLTRRNGPRRSAHLNFRIKIEESFQTRTQLFFNLFFAAFEHVHANKCFTPICEFHRGVAYFGDVFRGQQSQAID
jgi:hypothetical protein